jgi:hypothetical protein
MNGISEKVRIMAWGLASHGKKEGREESVMASPFLPLYPNGIMPVSFVD